MKATIKEVIVVGDRFYIKKVRGNYWGVYNRLDKSLESLCISKEEAEAETKKLNELRKQLTARTSGHKK